LSIQIDRQTDNKYEMINVYIDGACIHNGQPNAKAAYGVWFGHNDLRNESGPVIGKQSNNTGELTAFIRCLEILGDDCSQVVIHCDSEYVIKCATTYGTKLSASNWKTSTDKKPPNVELVKKAYELYQCVKKNVKLNYIRAHTGNTDEHSIGNAEVDKMANTAANVAAGRPVKSDEDVVANNIIRLNIPFANKDKAKELGAKWDIAKKYWYVNTKYVEKESVDAVMALQETEAEAEARIAERAETNKNETKKYIKVSYANKDKAKKLGARWDASVKSWYYVEGSVSDENISALKKL
jgi:ribonuclease HI